MSWQDPVIADSLTPATPWRAHASKGMDGWKDAYPVAARWLTQAVGPPPQADLSVVWVWLAGLPIEAESCPGPSRCPEVGTCLHRTCPAGGEAVLELSIPRNEVLALEWATWHEIALAARAGLRVPDQAPPCVPPSTGWDPLRPHEGTYIQGVCWELRHEWVTSLSLESLDATGTLVRTPLHASFRGQTP